MIRVLKWLFSLALIIVAAAYVVVTLPWGENVLARMGAFDPAYGSREDHARALAGFVERFPSRTVHRGGQVDEWPEAPRDLSTLTYKYDGTVRTINDFFDRNTTRSLVIIHKGQVVYEFYADDVSPNTRFTSMSVAKSFTSTLVGFAISDGLIGGVKDQLTDYLPDLKGTAYDGVTIENALEMSSGIRFHEDYVPGQIITDIGQFMALSAILNIIPADKAATLFPREYEPGTHYNYNTAETQILGALVHKVTGKHLADYLSEKLWSKIGAEHDAAWTLDAPEGMEVAGCCLNITTRDYARMGELFRLNGMWHGQRVLPEGWVAQATRSQHPQVMQGQLEESSELYGYAYQWWTRPNGDFAAHGVFGQYIHVSPENELVIAMNSAWPEGWIEEKNEEATAFFDGVAAYLSRALAR